MDWMVGIVEWYMTLSWGIASCNAFIGGEGCALNGLDWVHHSLQLLAFLYIRNEIPDHDLVSQDTSYSTSVTICGVPGEIPNLFKLQRKERNWYIFFIIFWCRSDTMFLLVGKRKDSGHEYKIITKISNRRFRRNFLIQGLVRKWNSLTRIMDEVKCIDPFKGRLDKYKWEDCMLMDLDEEQC